MSLKSKAFSGIKWSSFSFVILTITQIIQISILARYLEPKDFGLMALANVIISFATMFLDLGVGTAIIQKKDITDEELSTLYWFNILVGIVIFIIIIPVTPLVSNLYRQKELQNLIWIMSFLFIIIPFGQQFKFLLQKEFKFNTLAKIEIFSALMTLISALYMAINNFGVYTLVYATIISTTLLTISYIYSGLKIYKPGFIFKPSKIKYYINFGLYNSGSVLTWYIAEQADILIIGRAFSTEQLGFYSIGKSLAKRITILIPIINKVSYPLFSKLNNVEEDMSKNYLKVSNMLSSIFLPLTIALIFMAKPVVLLLYGKKFIESIIFFKIIAFTNIFTFPFISIIATVSISQGKIKIIFFWTLFKSSVLISTLYVASHYSILILLYSWFTANVLIIIPYYLFIVKKTVNITFFTYSFQIIRPLILSTISALSGVIYLTLFNNIILQIILISTQGLIVYLLLSNIFNKEFVSEFKQFLKNK